MDVNVIESNSNSGFSVVHTLHTRATSLGECLQQSGL